MPDFTGVIAALGVLTEEFRKLQSPQSAPEKEDDAHEVKRDMTPIDGAMQQKLRSLVLQKHGIAGAKDYLKKNYDVEKIHELVSYQADEILKELGKNV